MLDVLGVDLRKWRFSLDCLLSGSKGNSMNKPHLERGKNRVRLKLKLVKKQKSLILCRIGRCWVIFVVWTMFMIFLSSDMIMEWPGLTFMFCEIICVQTGEP